MSLRVFCGFLLLLALSIGRVRAEPSFWVWNRTEPLTAREVAELQAQGVHTLYWHIGELDAVEGSWRWRSRSACLQPNAGAFEVVPVVRLTPNLQSPFAPPGQLLAMVQAQLADEAPRRNLQIDFDCPDRLLGEFADFLTALHESVPQLSITALAHWIDRPEWDRIAAAVDEVAPMFYDLQTDPPVTGEHFAPLPEIAAALAQPDLPEERQLEIRAVLGMRFLQAEDLASAQKFLSAEAAGPVAQNLIRLTSEVAATKTAAAKAGKMMELGDAWAAARGKLLRAPLETDETKAGLFFSRAAQAGLRRRENARAAGLKEADAELEMRDELRHASRWWMRAARALPGSALAAKARWRALEAMPKLAARSEFAFQRAVESNAAGLSKELYNRLRAEAPDSVEAKRLAVYWSFPDRAPQSFEQFPNYQDDESREIDAVGKMGYRFLDYGSFGLRPDFAQDDENWRADERPWKPLRERMVALGREADPAALLAKVEALQKEVRALYRDLNDASYLAVLDDLARFLREPNLNAETRAAYVQQYLNATWRHRDHPLRYLGGYLSDLLGFAYQRPEQTGSDD